MLPTRVVGNIVVSRSEPTIYKTGPADTSAAPLSVSVY